MTTYRLADPTTFTYAEALAWLEAERLSRPGPFDDFGVEPINDGTAPARVLATPKEISDAWMKSRADFHGLTAAEYLHLALGLKRFLGGVW